MVVFVCFLNDLVLLKLVGFNFKRVTRVLPDDRVHQIIEVGSFLWGFLPQRGRLAALVLQELIPSMIGVELVCLF